MGSVRYSHDGSINGCRIVALENDRIRLEVMPELGGKIYRWIHKAEDRDYLWQNPAVRPEILPDGTGYDDHFCGGWDENFPSDSPELHDGMQYPDHGEYWTQPFAWDVVQDVDSLTLYLWAEGTVTPTRMERWITITAGSTVVRQRYRLTHLGGRAFDFIWKFHPALRVGASHELIVSAGRSRVASPGMGRLAEDPIEFTWPLAPGRDGRPVDLSRIPAGDVPNSEMVYVTELRDGWFALVDHASRSGFGMAFDRSLFNTLWLFQSFGGWHGVRVVVPEPATGYPYMLAEAAKSGRISRLESGQVIETETATVIFTDRDQVTHISRDGEVR